MPRAFKEHERDRLRARLIEAGKDLMNRLGYKSLTVEDAAREAGISKGSFYSFFVSKEDFVLSVFEAWESQYRNALIAQVSSGSGTPRERLQRFFAEAMAILGREPGMARLGMGEILRIMERLPPERLEAHQAADAKVAAEAVAGWVSSGLLSPEDAPALSGVFSALFVLAVHRGDFAPGTYEATSGLIAEALAMRLAGRKGEADV